MIEPVQSDDALLADIARMRERGGDALHLWWLGQSGFLVQHAGRHLLFDPYLSDSLTAKYANTEKPHVRMTRRVVDPAKLASIDFITSTHMHTDHADAETLRALTRASWAERRVSPVLIVPEANEIALVERVQVEGLPVSYDAVSEHEPTYDDDLVVEVVPSAHPTLTRDDLGRPTCVGFIARFSCWTLYHSGDTVVYDGLAERLRPRGIDVAILPINGKVGNMGGRDAARLAHEIGAKLVVPCHYEMFEFNTADPRDEFVPECERLGQPYRVLRAGERLTLGSGGAKP